MLFVLYLSLYSTGQFFLFIVRDNDIVLFHLKQAQLPWLIVQAAVVLFAWLIGQFPWWFDSTSRAMRMRTKTTEDDGDEDEEEEDLMERASSMPICRPVRG